MQLRVESRDSDQHQHMLAARLVAQLKQKLARSAIMVIVRDAHEL